MTLAEYRVWSMGVPNEYRVWLIRVPNEYRVWSMMVPNEYRVQSMRLPSQRRIRSNKCAKLVAKIKSEVPFTDLNLLLAPLMWL
jgi:hypothetical protein